MMREISLGGGSTGAFGPTSGLVASRSFRALESASSKLTATTPVSTTGFGPLRAGVGVATSVLASVGVEPSRDDGGTRAGPELVHVRAPHVAGAQERQVL